jgi:hypothetical protein
MIGSSHADRAASGELLRRAHPRHHPQLPAHRSATRPRARNAPQTQQLRTLIAGSGSFRSLERSHLRPRQDSNLRTGLRRPLGSRPQHRPDLRQSAKWTQDGHSDSELVPDLDASGQMSLAPREGPLSAGGRSWGLLGWLAPGTLSAESQQQPQRVLATVGIRLERPKHHYELDDAAQVSVYSPGERDPRRISVTSFSESTNGS